MPNSLRIQVCADASVADIEDQLFLTKTISPAGKYTLRLWDIHTQSWKQITIDDKIPCEEKLWFAPARPIVAKTLDSEAWVLLLEKVRGSLPIA